MTRSDEASGCEIVLAEALGAGSYVGEMALLDSAPRNATVTATSDLLCISLEQDRFLQLMSSALGVLRAQAARRKQDIIAREETHHGPTVHGASPPAHATSEQSVAEEPGRSLQSLQDGRAGAQDAQAQDAQAQEVAPLAAKIGDSITSMFEWLHDGSERSREGHIEPHTR